MNGIMERKKAPIGTKVEIGRETKIVGLVSYYPDTGNPFFQGVLRRYHLDAVGKPTGQNPENALFLRGNGGQAGVLDSKNLALYTYCHQNPLILVDPDGLWAISGDFAALAGFGITFGQSENKKYFIAFRANFGIGVGFGFDPIANQPGYTPDKKDKDYTTVAIQAEGSVSVGPVSINKVAKQGVVIEPSDPEVNEGPIITDVFKEKPVLKIEQKDITVDPKGTKIGVGGMVSFEGSITIKRSSVR